MELAGLVPSKASLLGLQVVSSPHVLMWSSLYVCVCVLTASSYKDTGHIGLGSTLMTSMDMNLSKLQEIVRARGAWRAIVHGVTKSQT